MSYRPKVMNSFDGSGSTYAVSDLKIWTSKVTSSAQNGSWAADLSAAKFKSVLCVQATAQADTASINGLPLAVVRSYTSTEIHGWVLQNNTGAILIGGMFGGLKFATTATQVFVTVIGT